MSCALLANAACKSGMKFVQGDAKGGQVGDIQARCCPGGSADSPEAGQIAAILLLLVPKGVEAVTTGAA